MLHASIVVGPCARSNQGVLHRDIKRSYLLLDNCRILKIADFGLSSFFDPNKKQPMTSRVVTLRYRPPELLLGATDYGAVVDLWSAVVSLQNCWQVSLSCLVALRNFLLGIEFRISVSCHFYCLIHLVRN